MLTVNIYVQDLNNFSLELHRIGTSDWMDLQEGDDALASFVAPKNCTNADVAKLEAKHLENFLQKRCSYHARLEITFEVSH